jgi:hypothetical protein
MQNSMEITFHKARGVIKVTLQQGSLFPLHFQEQQRSSFKHHPAVSTPR